MLARSQGRLISSEFSIAEITPVCGPQTEALVASLSIDFVASSKQNSLRTVEMIGAYFTREGKQRGIVADFLIGAHAVKHADRLLMRDDGFLRDHFSTGQIWYP
jgi:predicted nucleic acid-binding protein